MLVPLLADSSFVDKRLKIGLYTVLLVEAIVKIVMICIAVPEQQGGRCLSVLLSSSFIRYSGSCGARFECLEL